MNAIETASSRTTSVPTVLQRRVRRVIVAVASLLSARQLDCLIEELNDVSFHKG